MNDLDAISHSPAAPRNRRRLLLAAVLTAFVAYGAAFVAHSSVPVDDGRAFVLFDDAMISMRYARNLAEGQGLVWNPGEAPVEGYTNLGWVLGMTGLHLLPLTPATVGLAVQLLALALLVLNLLLVHRLVERLAEGRGPYLPLAAVALTAVYFPLNFWSLTGMEVAAVTPLVTGAALLAVTALREGRFDLRPHLLLGLGQILRPDVAVPAGALVLYLFVFDGAHRRRHALAGALAIALPACALTLFRWLYYGDVLPNTYYLKVTGFPLLVRLGRGAARFWQFLAAHLVVPVLAPLLWALFARRRDVGLLAWLFACQAAYSVYVGGDAWEHGWANRYLAVAVPLLFVLLVLALRAGLARLRMGPSARRALFALLVAAVAVVCNTYKGAESLRWLLLQQAHPDVVMNRDLVRRAHLIEAATQEDAVVAVVTAGTIPYLTDRPSIDLLGKNDAVIAHGPARLRPERPLRQVFRPGHSKWDYDYAIRRRAPDVVAQLYGSQEEGLAAMGDDYQMVGPVDGVAFFVRKGSPRVRWDALAEPPFARP